MRVLKFGGSSIAHLAAIHTVAEILKQKQETSEQIIVVFSALGGVTNDLVNILERAVAGQKEEGLAALKTIEERHITLCKELLSPQAQGEPIAGVKMLVNELEDWITGISVIQEVTQKSTDKILGFGERLSTLILHHYFQSKLGNTQLLDPQEFIICQDEGGVLMSASAERTKNICLQKLNIVPGFIASNEQGDMVTLGRGGSDYTAGLLAHFFDAEELEIWTDVNGLMTADPRYVRNAHVIRDLSYEEALELSNFGAKVLYPPSIQPAMAKDIPILIKNTFEPQDPGSRIIRKYRDQSSIRGISSIRNMSLLNLRGSGMVGIPRFSFRLFETLSRHRINVVMITQASSEHTICVGIESKDRLLAEGVINETFEHEIEKRLLRPVEVEEGLAVLALVGSNMRNQVGVSGQMFSVLGRNGVSIKAIAQGSSERNISVVIRQNDLTKALNVLHESFFTEEIRRVNLFMVGVGNVGKALLGQIAQQQDYLREKHLIDLQIMGIANSKKMRFAEDKGLSSEKYMEALESGEPYDITGFIENMAEMNLRNSVFLDVTASVDVASAYAEILKRSISIATPNKIAATNAYASYRQLKELQNRYRTQFLFETNVCAGLPVISTLSDLIKSGDRIHKIQAVLSGTLNFLFNEYDGNKSFASIVKRAKEEGYAEPDPRLDLSGEDVRRKILILARESGYEMEVNDIRTRTFVPDVCMDAADVEDFFDQVEAQEDHFRKILEEAGDRKIRYVAQFDEDGASTGLEFVDPSHPFYHLEGSDNIVLFYTDRYPEQPLVVKGAGAGASVTASGIFADIMRIASAN